MIFRISKNITSSYARNINIESMINNVVTIASINLNDNMIIFFIFELKSLIII